MQVLSSSSSVVVGRAMRSAEANLSLLADAANNGGGGGGGGEGVLWPSLPTALPFPFPWPWPITETPTEPLANASSTDCSEEWHLRYQLDVAALSAAAGLVVLLNLCRLWKLSRRVKGDCLSSLPNVLAIPVDFLLVTPYRIIYCIILCLWAADTFHDFMNLDLYYRSSDDVVDAVLFFGVSPMVIILRQALLYFPVLACVDSNLPLLSHCTGCIYTLLMGVRSVYHETVIVRGCSIFRGQLQPRDVGVSLGMVAPTYIGYVGVACWFFWHAAIETALVLFTDKKLWKSGSDDLEVYGAQVKQLLRNNKEFKLFSSEVELKQSLIRGLQYVLPFRFSNHIKFPLPFLAAVSMAFTLLYQICIVLVSHEMIYMGRVIDWIDRFNITAETLEFLFPKQKLMLENFYYDVQSFAQALRILFPLAHWTGWILTVFFSLYMVQNFHKHLLRAARGDLSFLLASEPLPSLSYRLAAGMRYIPFQLGHMIVGFFLYSLVVIILGLIGWCYYYLFKNHTFYGVHYWCLFMVPYMWAFAMHFLQLLLCRYVFLDRRQNGNVTVIKIRFRRLYLLVTYLVLFFDVIYSMAMGILRVLGTLIFNIVMVFRLDRDLYLRGLEGWDLGHRTYVGYLYLEYFTNNPILRTFIALLNRKGAGQATPTGRTPSYSIQSHAEVTLAVNTDLANITEIPGPSNAKTVEGGEWNEDKGEGASLITATSQSAFQHIPSIHGQRRPQSRSVRARNRWLVAYTLLRNPNLQLLTANRLILDRDLMLGNHLSLLQDHN